MSHRHLLATLFLVTSCATTQGGSTEPLSRAEALRSHVDNVRAEFVALCEGGGSPAVCAGAVRGRLDAAADYVAGRLHGDDELDQTALRGALYSHLYAICVIRGDCGTSEIGPAPTR